MPRMIARLVPRRGAPAVAWAIVALVLSGCLLTTTSRTTTEGCAPGESVPPLGLAAWSPPRFGPGQEYQALVITAPASGSINITSDFVVDEKRVASSMTHIGGDAAAPTTTVLTGVVPDTPLAKLGYNVVVQGRDACEVSFIVFGAHQADTATISDQGVTPVPGQGVLVRYAGFWENGTLFGTNMPAVDALEVPRAAWYAFDGDEPLPVYVYDQDRSEEGPEWLGASGNLASAGAPVEAQNGAAVLDGIAGTRYYSTIKGFNEALKGTSTVTSRVVHVAPEDAYTREGNEAHPLYGDAILFVIGIELVLDQPCPRNATSSTPYGTCATLGDSRALPPLGQVG